MYMCEYVRTYVRACSCVCAFGCVRVNVGLRARMSMRRASVIVVYISSVLLLRLLRVYIDNRIKYFGVGNKR